MVQILDEVPSFGSQFARQLGSTLSGATAGALEGYAQKKQNEAFERQFGISAKGLTPEMKQEFVKQMAKGQAQLELAKKLFPRRFQPTQPMGERLQGKEDIEPISQQKERDEQPQGFENLTPEERILESFINPAVARQATEEEKMKTKERTEKSGRHFEIAKDFIKSVNSKAEGLPQKEIALDEMINAIKEGNLGFFTRDNLSELTGIEGFRSPEAAIFKTAGKEFFLGTLKGVGAKGLNQWLERQITDMMPKIGRSREANLVVTEMLKTELDLQKKQIELANETYEEQEKKYGGPRQNISADVMKKLHSYALDKQKELKEKIEDIKEKYEPQSKEGVLMYDPAGGLRRVPAKDIKEAKKSGYTIYK